MINFKELSFSTIGFTNKYVYEKQPINPVNDTKSYLNFLKDINELVVNDLFLNG